MRLLSLSKASAKELRQARAHARTVSGILKALSHDGRLLILCLLAGGEATVSEIVAKLGMPQALVSQKLTRLRLDGMVKTRREGRNIHYTLARPELAELLRTLNDLLCKPPRRSARKKP